MALSPMPGVTWWRLKRRESLPMPRGIVNRLNNDSTDLPVNSCYPILNVVLYPVLFMTENPKIVNMNELEWQEAHYSEHYTGWSKRLTPSMDRRQGHMGVVV
jgi:hypothetical protein